MKKYKNVPLKILFISLAVLLVAYFTFSKRDQKKFHWLETYKSTSDQPYGTLFIQQLLATFRPGKKFILNDKKPLHKVLDSTQIETKTDYVFIGNEIFLDDADKNALLKFIFLGNDAFISTVNLPFDIIEPMFYSECGKSIFLVKNDTLSVTLNFYNSSLKSSKGYSYAYRFGKTDQPYYWQTLNPEVFCDSTTVITPMGYIHPDKVNFFKLSYGNGNLYVHTNPLVFTNYFLTKRDKAEYAASTFSLLHGETIIWDEFSKSKFTSKNNASDISPIAYILQQDSLRYAWWLMLFGVVLYVVFAAKRKQRIIPVFEPKTNTSLEFVNMISALHFQNGNRRDIARKKMKYFFYFIRAKYSIHTQHLTELYVKRLSEKSKIEPEDLVAIAHQFTAIEKEPYYQEAMLVSLYNALEKFYNHCK